MKSIYAFNDFRKYLEYHYSYKKKVSSSFSYERFSRVAGMKSNNYLKLVIEGKRNLSINGIYGFSRALELNFDETQYFEALVLADQESNTQVQMYYKKKAKQLLKVKPQSVVQSSEDLLVKNWFYPAVLVTCEGLDLEQAPGHISKLIGVPERDTRKAVEELIKSGVILVTVDEQPRLRLNSEYFVAWDSKKRKAQHKFFLKQQLERSFKALEQQYEGPSKFVAHTFTIEKSNFEYFADRIDIFIEELTAHSNKERVEKVVQLNLQYFSV